MRAYFILLIPFSRALTLLIFLLNNPHEIVSTFVSPSTSSSFLLTSVTIITVTTAAAVEMIHGMGKGKKEKSFFFF